MVIELLLADNASKSVVKQRFRGASNSEQKKKVGATIIKMPSEQAQTKVYRRMTQMDLALNYHSAIQVATRTVPPNTVQVD
ncbi:hypothetical protein T265_15040, partial [Opisthorchis viverrini]